MRKIKSLSPISIQVLKETSLAWPGASRFILPLSRLLSFLSFLSFLDLEQKDKGKQRGGGSESDGYLPVLVEGFFLNRYMDEGERKGEIENYDEMFYAFSVDLGRSGRYI